jgi:ketosteroid isomerase-like protein
MSQEEENMAVVRKTIESYANDVEAWLDTLDPEVRWYPSEEHPSLVLGRAAARKCRDRWMETFDDGETYGDELEELRGRGEDVFAVVHVWGHGRRSGIEIDDRNYIHFKVRDGKVVYCYEYRSRDEALEAAGLRE